MRAGGGTGTDMNDVLAIILGGGRGTRLFPLTHMRSKPAVPIGGKYRLIDVPISNCLHAGHASHLRAHAVQLGVAQPAHRADATAWTSSRGGFVEILAAEQTPDNPNWFQGTADAVRQAARHFADYDADYYLILAGDHLYRMDYARADRRARRTRRRHHDRGAAGRRRATPTRWASSASIATASIVAFEEKPNAEAPGGDRHEHPRTARPSSGHPPDKPFVASMGIYVFSRDVLLEITRPGDRVIDFGHEIIPALLGHAPRQRRTCSAATGRTSERFESFYDANIMLTRRGRAVQLLRPAAADLHPAAVPARLAPASTAPWIARSWPRAASSTGARWTTRWSASARAIRRGVVASHAPCCSAPTSTRPTTRRPEKTTGRDSASASTSVLDRVIVDKNARIGDGVRLVNAAGVQQADGDGYYIRNGIVIVPKGGLVKDGTTV